ncbi:hydroxyproline-rich glycoprotein family protein [Actinidia rufa]|uniref:Hydroxyproline-rich glycoprotein family protein n=1 Tax=Actinidia rufa TaxID=165716 RepID=A0A7J0GGF3_9ERIC|nr:hydroxyproline-rich glycoprotein family protein [Actinidia rufa]
MKMMASHGTQRETSGLKQTTRTLFPATRSSGKNGPVETRALRPSAWGRAKGAQGSKCGRWKESPGGGWLRWSG